MKPYKHNVQRKPPGELPCFPEPYPGEAFYSVLCRYHVRSGNVNSWHTLHQLFGYPGSLASTLLAPFHFEMIKHWVPISSGITLEKMLRQNTAFNLYALTCIPSEISCIHDVIAERKKTSSFPRCMLPRTVNPSRHLRFCPECAATQKKLYGEPYWQVLPQTDDVEYCPLHGTRIQNSPVPLTDIRFKFHPASTVIKEAMSPTVTEYSKEWESLFREERRFFMKLSQGIAWLLQHGEPYAGYSRLVASYNRLLNKTDGKSWLEIKQSKVRDVLSHISHSNKLYEYLESKNPHQFFSDSLYVYSLRPCSHVMVMTAMCGSPKSFYEA